MFMILCPVLLEIFIRKYGLDKVVLFYFNFLRICLWPVSKYIFSEV